MTNFFQRLVLSGFLSLLLVNLALAQPIGVLPARTRITTANAETLSLYMVQAKRAERVLWSPGGTTLAVMDGVDIDLYTVADWLAPPVKVRLDQAPTDLAFSPNGQTLYAAVPGSIIGFATVGGGQTFRYVVDARRIALSPDGVRMGVITRAGALEIHNLTERTGFQLAPTADDMTFTPDGRRVIARMTDGGATAFDLVTRQPEFSYGAEGYTDITTSDVPLHGVHVTGDGRTLLLPAGNGAALATFPVSTSGVEAVTLDLPAQYIRLYGWGVHTRARLVIGAAIAQTPPQSAVLIWNLTGGAPIATLRHPGVRDAAPSPDGTLIASVGGGTLRLWALAESLPTLDQIKSISAVNVVAACDVYGGKPQLGEVLAGQTVSLVWSWYALTPQQIRDYLDAALYDLRLDGAVTRPWVFVSQTVLESVNDNNPTVYLYAPIGTLTAGNHISQVTVTWTRTINDGFADFGPDTSNPSDGGTCTFTVS